MKYKFENNSLAIYQIKELLKDFNLPMISVYTEETFLFKNSVYIKGNEVVKWDGEKFIHLYDYSYNKKIVNLTKNFVINSSNYDTYTHRYLGDYLRFLRDYKHLDLMSLYNCFDYAQPSRILYTSNLSEYQHLNIDTSNDCYMYYVIPVNFNKTYTIAIDSDLPYDMSCILFNNNFIDFTPITLRKKSYKKINGSRYNSPFVYSTAFFEGKDVTDTYIKRCLDHEKDLYILLRLPVQVKSTITVLEGNYMNFSNIVDRQLITNNIWNDESDLPATFLTKSSLLKCNDHTSYPFADRLIEFLLGNAITHLDNNMANIQRVQSNVSNLDDYTEFNGVWTDSLRKEVYDYMNYNVKKLKSNKIIKSYFKDKEIFKFNRRGLDLNYDLTGYVDKDAEQYLEVN